VVAELAAASGLDLDRAESIVQLVALDVVTQGFNRQPVLKKGVAGKAVDHAPALYRCDDPDYDAKLRDYVPATALTNQTERKHVRDAQALGAKPRNMAKDYDVTFVDD
jgi:hypothetical protein